MELLLSVSLRALIPAGIACAVLGIGRVKSAARRHAVWTVVMTAMLLYLLMAPFLPSIPVRVLPGAVPAGAQAGGLVDTAPPIPVATLVPIPVQTVAGSWPLWHLVLSILYGAGVLISLLRLAAGYAHGDLCARRGALTARSANRAGFRCR
jgi:hypothetical protein